MSLLLAGTSMQLLRAVWPMLLAGTLVAAIATLMLARKARGSSAEADTSGGRPFNPVEALIFAGLLGAILLLSAGLKAWFGSYGVWIAAASAGLADVHAVTLSTGQLANSQMISVDDARWALVLGFSTNLGTKMFLAHRAGSAYFQRLWPGHVTMLVAVIGAALAVR
jgi:uncharacterized membrane protein (DUF4010 family)